MDKKQLEAKAKQVVAEGKSLEQAGQLGEANDKYIDAEAFISTKDALNGIERVRHAQEKQVASAIADAHRLYDAGQFAAAAEKLEKALEIRPASPTAHYNLALCYQKLEDRARAVQHLDQSIGASQNNKERLLLLELRTALLTGAKPPASNGDTRKGLESFNAAYLQADRGIGDNDPSAEKKASAAGGDLCDQAKQLLKLFPSDPALLFNLAKCAEQDARQDEAARLLTEYQELAPQALDGNEAQVRREDFSSLASLEGESGEKVRARYAAAARYIDYRRYDRALAEYEAAEQLLPVYPQTQWRLALLHEAFGDTSNARRHFARFQELETSPELKAEAARHLDSLDKWRADYDSDIEDAQDILTALLLHSMGLNFQGGKHRAKLNKRQQKASSRYQKLMMASETMSSPYVQRQLDHAREDLEDATTLFPLGIEANELLALIYLEGNNWPAAFRCFDAVASQGLPVSFYAQLNDKHDSKFIRATKLEIGKDTVRLVYLSSYNGKKKITEAPENPAGDDDLGNLVTSAGQPPDEHAEALSIQSADLKSVETNKSLVVLKLNKDELYLAPVYMITYTPFEGPVARSFGNEYTRLFVRYLGYETAKLGKEGMTFGEKVKLGYSFLDTAMSYYSAVTSGGIDSYSAFSSTRKLAHTLNVDLGSLRQSIGEQRRAVDGMQFKSIPSEPIQLPFREKF